MHYTIYYKIRATDENRAREGSEERERERDEDKHCNAQCSNTPTPLDCLLICSIRNLLAEGSGLPTV